MRRLRRLVDSTGSATVTGPPVPGPPVGTRHRVHLYYGTGVGEGVDGGVTDTDQHTREEDRRASEVTRGVSGLGDRVGPNTSPSRDLNPRRLSHRTRVLLVCTYVLGGGGRMTGPPDCES